jgi:small conductance mechanosensitive channel
VPDVNLNDVIAESSVDIWDIVLAIVVLLVAWIASRIAARGMRSLTGRLEGVSPDLANLATRVVRTFVIMLGFGVALVVMGASIQPVLAAAIIVAVVAALALRGVAENWAAGIVLQTQRPLTVGDVVEIGDFTGTVLEVNGRAVVIETFDGAVVHLPNAETLANPIVNRTARASRRSAAELRVARAGIDPEQLLTLIGQAASGTEGVLAEPSVMTVVRALDEQHMTIQVMFWHVPTESATVSSNVVLALGSALADIDSGATIVSPPPPAPPPPPPPAR